MAKEELRYGEVVSIPWGVDRVQGTVHDIYGTAPRVYVVVMLTPERSSEVVAEPTTVVMPHDSVMKVA